MIFFCFIAIYAQINMTAVNAFIEAYMGGRKLKGSTFGILIPNKIATATGIATETKIIHFLYFTEGRFMSLLFFTIYSLNSFGISSISISVPSINFWSSRSIPR